MPDFASRKSKGWAVRKPQCAPGGLWSLGGRARNLQDTCELLPPLRESHDHCGHPENGCEGCWGSCVPCSLLTARKYHVIHKPLEIGLVFTCTSFKGLLKTLDEGRTDNLPPMLTYFGEISKTTAFSRNSLWFTICTWIVCITDCAKPPPLLQCRQYCIVYRLTLWSVIDWKQPIYYSTAVPLKNRFSACVAGIIKLLKLIICHFHFYLHFQFQFTLVEQHALQNKLCTVR